MTHLSVVGLDGHHPLIRHLILSSILFSLHVTERKGAAIPYCWASVYSLNHLATIWIRGETPEELLQSSSSRTQPTPQPLSLRPAQATEAIS